MGTERGHVPHTSRRVGEVAIGVVNGGDVIHLVGGVIRRGRCAGGPVCRFNGGSNLFTTWRGARQLGAAEGKQGARATRRDALLECNVMEGAMIALPPRGMRRADHGEGGGFGRGLFGGVFWNPGLARR